jgi:hypothetical protein
MIKNRGQFLSEQFAQTLLSHLQAAESATVPHRQGIWLPAKNSHALPGRQSLAAPSLLAQKWIGPAQEGPPVP